MLKSKMESLNNLATLLDRRYKKLKTKGVRFTMIYDKLNSELISLTHEYYYKELGLEESHPWGFDYNLGDNGGVYDDIGKGILLNYEIIRPVDYLFAGLDTNDECKKEQYFNIGIELLSCVVHELRHAWQDEMGLLKGLRYVSAEENFEKYRQQDVEIDAREYQSHFFTKDFYEYLLKEYIL